MNPIPGGLNPMMLQNNPMSPQAQALRQMLVLLGGLGPQNPQGTPQPQPNSFDPILGGLSGVRA